MRWIPWLFALLAVGCTTVVDPPRDAPPLTDAQPLTDAAIDARDPSESPSHPLVTRIDASGEPSAAMPLAITVLDATSPTIALLLLVSCDQTATWAPATTLDPLTALAADGDGETHVIRWDATADLDPTAPTCFIAAIATDPTGLSSEILIAAIRAPGSGPAGAGR